jgi:ABC-type uncharacterized transport system YnjBCD ATPase subunit
MTADRKKVALRKLEAMVRTMFRADETSLSGLQHGRLAVELRHLLARLKRLLRDDPDDIFWEVLQQAILKTLKYLRRL